MKYLKKFTTLFIFCSILLQQNYVLDASPSINNSHNSNKQKESWYTSFKSLFFAPTQQDAISSISIPEKTDTVSIKDKYIDLVETINQEKKEISIPLPRIDDCTEKHTFVDQKSYVTVNSIDSTYNLNFTTMFLKPSSNLLYAGQAVSLPIGSPSWDVFQIKPHYNFAFDLGAKIFLHEQTGILKGNWEHFLSADSAAFNVANTAYMVGPFFALGPDTSVFKITNGNVKYSVDKLHVTYGQSIEVGKNLVCNIHAGISFSRLNQQLTQFFQHYHQMYT